MGGLGLLNRRRAIQSAPVENEDYWDYYVQDSLLLCIDGLRPGDTSQGWQELITGNYFANNGAVYQDNGWVFDGKASYMDADEKITNYGFYTRERTLEVVLEFSAKNITSPVLIGKTNGISFGISRDNYVIGNSEFPYVRMSPTSELKCSTAIVVNSLTIVRAMENGVSLNRLSSNGAWSAAKAIRLGASSTLSSYLQGKIYAIRIHNRLLTEEEILNNQQIDKIRFGL